MVRDADPDEVRPELVLRVAVFQPRDPSDLQNAIIDPISTRAASSGEGVSAGWQEENQGGEIDMLPTNPAARAAAAAATVGGVSSTVMVVLEAAEDVDLRRK